MKKITLITGPGGSGKTAIAQLLAKKYNAIWIDGDNEDSEFFPDGGQWDAQNSKLLSQAHDKIIRVAKLASKDKPVVIDYIIFDQFEGFFDKLKKEFVDDLDIKILLPDKEIIMARNSARSSWKTSNERIIRVYEALNNLRDKLGSESYIDNSEETPEETVIKHFNL